MNLHFLTRAAQYTVLFSAFSLGILAPRVIAEPGDPGDPIEIIDFVDASDPFEFRDLEIEALPDGSERVIPPGDPQKQPGNSDILENLGVNDGLGGRRLSTGFGSGLLPPRAFGGGTLEGIFSAAVNVWETAIADSGLPKLTLEYGWADFGLDPEEINFNGDEGDEFIFVIPNDIVGVHICQEYISLATPRAVKSCSEGEVEDDFLEAKATILFNSQTLDLFDASRLNKVFYYLDPDPLGASPIFGASFDREPLRRALLTGVVDSPDLSSGVSALGNFSGFAFAGVEPGEKVYVVDLFSVAMHEIGHALGFSLANPRLQSPDSVTFLGRGGSGTVNFSLDTVPGVPGSVRSAHIPDDVATKKLSDEFVRNGERRCPSDLDVLVTAKLGRAQRVRSNPCDVARKRPDPQVSIPEPGLGIAFIGVTVSLLRRRKSVHM